MILAVDSSVLVAALVTAESRHEACNALLDEPGIHVYSHALVEAFNTLTGGRLGYRIPPEMAAELVERSLLPSVQVVSLSAKELISAFREAKSRGVRGSAIYDYLHLAAARKAGAARFHTLDVSDFAAIHRPGDPEIVSVA